MKEIGEMVARLEETIYHHELLLQQAIKGLCETRQIDETAVSGLKSQLNQITGGLLDQEGGGNDQHSELATPELIATSISGIVLEAKQDMHFSAQGNFCVTAINDVSMATMKNYNITSSKSIKMFSHQGGVKLYANKNDIELQAQNDNMRFTAKKALEIVSTDQTIDIVAAKQIRLRCEGAQILMNKDGITLITDGTFKVKANRYELQQGQAIGVDLKGLPIVDLFNEKFQILSPSGKPMPFVDYKLSSKDQSILSSTTDTGETKEVHTPQEKDLSLELVWMALEPTLEDDETQVMNITKGDYNA